MLYRDHIDGYLQVSDEEAVRMARRLAREEGIFAGFSSGANAAAALQLLSGPCKGRTIVILMNDSGFEIPEHRPVGMNHIKVSPIESIRLRSRTIRM